MKIEDQELNYLSEILKITVSMKKSLNDSPYNLILHAAPLNEKKKNHTRIAIIGIWKCCLL